MSLVNEYEAAKVRNEKLQRIAKTLTDASECFHSAVQELHDVVVDTFIAGLDGRTDDTAKSWMDGFQESLEQTEIHLDDFCKGLKDHLVLPSKLTTPPSDASQLAEKEMDNSVIPLSLRSLHAMAKYLDGHHAGMAKCAAGVYSIPRGKHEVSEVVAFGCTSGSFCDTMSGTDTQTEKLCTGKNTPEIQSFG
ncbi:hypothetical protein RvY_15728 [Ramazzottius varieornatus]|uniref:Uncharacterized protein n=1 Tax=Ramazzottius varieornatus TaxID=947166 RepID=A0A1D1W0I9_RAMVA|nr:hypothetical protein RvY_15728 [Ramazzottius varieornatus]